MKLSDLQQRRIEQYLRDVETRLSGLGAEARRDALGRLKTRIADGLRATGEPYIANVDLEAILRSAESPETRKSPSSEARSTRGESIPDARWLGVCAWLSQRLEIEPLFVRGVVLAIGLVTGPVAVIAYLAGYFALYATDETYRRVPIEVRTLAGAVITFIAVAIGLRVASVLLLNGLLAVYTRIVQAGTIDLGGWLWIRADASRAFWLAVFVGLPWAVLGGLPAVEKWPGTFRKFAEMILALYAVWLAVGLGAVLAGMLLSGARALGPTIQVL